MKQPPSPAAIRFGAKVRRARIALGLSQESIAELAQMHVTNYGKIERGIANPSLVTMLRIASVLGTDIALLTEGLSRDDLPDDVDVLSADEFLQERARRR
ncbi:helix-turn-helix domain-containing protein [Leifsonia sp. NPDC056824]|uniref:helix-turn-helix domain-containing protein n=1 Tax=Leifsonia sp. NPDC056824 TaxID=3345953 RepID=UPI0036A81FD0